MKNYILLTALILATKISIAQVNVKTIPVNDIRKAGISKYDTSTAGYKEGDVKVELTYRGQGKINDSTEEYLVHFYKKYNNNLMSYMGSVTKHTDFDKASYLWLNDTTVAINLINSTTKNIKTIFLEQMGRGASIGVYDKPRENLKDLVEEKKIKN